MIYMYLPCVSDVYDLQPPIWVTPALDDPPLGDPSSGLCAGWGVCRRGRRGGGDGGAAGARIQKLKCFSR